MVAITGRLRNRRVAVLAAAMAVLVVAVTFVAYSVGRSSPGYDTGATSVAPAVGAAPEVAAAPVPTDNTAAQGGSAAALPRPTVTPDRSLVRTAQLSIDVADPADTVRRVRVAVAAAGGYVAQEQSGDGGSTLVLQIPADAFDRTVDAVGGYGTVTSRESQTTDVTDQVVDLDARVASQQASVDRVRLLLAKATSIGDVVSIESELAQREGELDSLKNRLAAVRGTVSFSTLTVNLSGPGATGPTPEGPGGFLGGLTAGWDGLRTLGVAAGATLGFVLPFLPVIAVALGVGWVARRIVRARRPVVAGGREGES